MKVIPAIDLKDGQCVRLQKGDYGTAHKVAENAVETARRFLEAGASLIHMVDLDAAKDGSHANYGVVEQVIRETGATVELGGGIRSMRDVETVRFARHYRLGGGPPPGICRGGGQKVR